MGLFSKLKSIKNAVTGGAAKVYIESEALSFTEPFRVMITVQTDDAPVKINRAYLKVVACEEVEVPDVDVEYDNDNDQAYRKLETVWASNDTIDLDLTVADGQELEANETYKWEVEVELPQGAPAIYRGHYCQHVYRAFAGLDCFGNDPDSGWVELVE
ncbi:hypothetical protein [Marinomonas sp. THO17]|uniref:hypothetical protein n=1 Tax=Marinomonas sp. THO17 TaxID=3149048 RepID=UPI00336C2EF8